MTSKSKVFHGRIAKKMMLYIILISTLIAIITSSFQIFIEYKRDIKEVNTGLEQIEDIHLSNIVSRVWVLDTEELQITLNSLINLPSIKYIAVYENNKLLMSAGSDISKNLISYKHPLIYDHNNNKNNIGDLIVKASMDEAYQHAIDSALVILVSNTIKTFIVSGMMLLIFYNLIARHLNELSEFSEQLSIDNLHNKFKYNRKENPTDKLDELDMLNIAIANMQDNLSHATQELKEKEQDLAITLHSIGDAVVATDATGKVTRMNLVAETLTGWSIEDAKGMPLKTIFPIINASTREAIDSPVDKVISHGKTIYLSNHTTLISKNGNEYNIADSAAPIRNENYDIVGVVLVFNDVTEQYRLREEAAKTKRDLQAIMNHSPAIIYVKNIDSQFMFINKKFEKTFDIRLKDTIGKDLHKVFPKDIADEMKKNDLEVIQTGHALESEEIVFHDNSPHTYHSIKFPLLDDNGSIYATCGISSDITEQKSKDEQLRRTQKMDSLGKLTGGIAHDYNNMLGVITGYSELLISALSDQPKLVKYATEIKHAGDRGAKMTKKLLSFTKMKSTDIDVEKININNLLHDEKHMLEKTLTARITLEYDLDDDLSLVMLDSGDLEDSIINLCINAMHSIESNGNITIRTRNTVISEHDTHLMPLGAGEYIMLSITDNGCGIDNETKEKIFDPFFTTKGELGTGLGLSQVYGFVNRSNGLIKVYSELNKGTQFVIYFPRYYEENTKINNTEKSDSYITKGHEKILIVDDEPSLLMLTNEILSQHGYQTFTACGAKEALAILETETMDLLLSDIIMPEIDGYQLASLIQEKNIDVKIQFTSGFSDSRYSNMVDSNLHQNILHKPFNSIDLLNKVRERLNES